MTVESSIINRIDNNQFWSFNGGIHPPEQKFLTNNKPIASLNLPEILIIPVQQHIGQAGNLLVKEGEYVLKGQPLTDESSAMVVPIHASTSGTIVAIKNTTLAHPSGMHGLCVFLKPDGKDIWREQQQCSDFYTLSREEIIQKVSQAGISGMGGAGFPTHFKLNTKPVINFLIINAVECEPYITADDLLMQEYSQKIVEGIKILDHLLLPEYILIGIEDNKPEAIKVLKEATQAIDKVRICILPTKYPSGGEKQLIQVLTGQEVPSGTYPSDLGIVMQNIATCFAIADAVLRDIPLIERVVTVTGQGLDKPQNVWAKIGTPISYLMKECGRQVSNNKHLIMGGPMMGFSLSSDQIPVVKTTNCVLVPSLSEIPHESKEVECIRCGECADVCPSKLLPQELQWSAKAKDYEQLEKLNLSDCIDCGACAYVCPSQIPLVQYYRVAKAEVRHLHVQEIKAEKAKARFEARKHRLEKEKQIRAEKSRIAAEARKARMNAGTPEASNAKSAVAAALARVNAKKANAQTGEQSTPPASSQKSAVADAIARAKAKKLAAKNNELSNKPVVENTGIESNNTADDKKANVAAAIAKAKAKKLAEKQANDNNLAESQSNTEVSHQSLKAEQPTSTAADDKKARVAAAVAKAKAKKLAEKQASDNNLAESQSNTEVSNQSLKAEQPTSTATDDKKARVAAAVAKAKAKKLVEKQASDNNLAEDQSNTEVSNQSLKAEQPTSTTDDKKARVAAAVAKAKAKKLAEKQARDSNLAESQSNTEVSNQSLEAEQPTSAADDKKARVAAAVAKAKAKKLAAKNSQTTVNSQEELK